jgi:hypothetical protein
MNNLFNNSETSLFDDSFLNWKAQSNDHENLEFERLNQTLRQDAKNSDASTSSEATEYGMRAAQQAEWGQVDGDRLGQTRPSLRVVDLAGGAFLGLECSELQAGLMDSGG